jgi:hypothetical protein
MNNERMMIMMSVLTNLRIVVEKHGPIESGGAFTPGSNSYSYKSAAITSPRMHFKMTMFTKLPQEHCMRWYF